MIASELIPGRHRQEATALSCQIAEALLVPPAIADDRDPARWRDQSLSKGAAGIAILHAVRARDGLTGTHVVRAWLRAAIRRPLCAVPAAGLWFGPAAVGFSLHCAAPGRCQQSLSRLDQVITDLTARRLATAISRLDAGARPSLTDFDLVSGLTGLGAYLLSHDPGQPLLRDILRYLIRLTGPVHARDDAGTEVPGWWTADLPARSDPGSVRQGHTDLGMAHGVTGILAFLSLARLSGVTVNGQENAICVIAEWVEDQQQVGPAGPWWPERVTLAALRGQEPAQAGPSRPSWCYGTPGISRALQLAAIAIGDRGLQQRAEDALARCLTDPTQLAQVTDPATCHGWSGVLATAWHAAADDQSGLLATALPDLTERLLVSARHAVVAGFPTGLIEGSAGIAAVLSLVATGTPGGWERCMLIS
jgi:lantibiotic biosynthesis protein